MLYSIVVHGRAELSLLTDEYAALTMVLLRLLAFPPAGPAPVAASAPRAAPLVAAPREARSTAPARPLVPVVPVPVPVLAPAPAQPPAATRTPATLSHRPQPPATAPRRVNAAEPPPWAEEAVPDDFSALDAADAGLPPQHDRVADLPATAAPPARPVSAAIAPVAPLVNTPLGDRWAALVRPLAAAGSLVAMVRELAWQAELLSVSVADGGGQRWQLRVERESLRHAGLATKLAAVLAETLGEPAQVEVLAGVPQDSIARRDNHAREAAQRAAEQLIHTDPEVQALMAQFRTARIVPGSIQPIAAAGGPLTPPKASPP